MKIYLVGGAVRDQLLGRPVQEKDWVVVGATQHDMLQKGFRQVGKDFPVFLHPKTQEEYALARKERKIGKGYTGFTFDTDPTVTLEEDLMRRDITINAIAMAEDGTIIDPYHGQEDLKNHILRHVSPAFSEDPVRILRIARFAARFGFQIAPETLALMRNIVRLGEVDALVPERVWKELERALIELYPHLFFKALSDCDAMKPLFPCLSSDSLGVKTLAKTPADRLLRFATLMHDVAYHDVLSLCERYKIPHDERALALLVNKYLPDYRNVTLFTAAQWIDFFQRLDAFRREKRFQDFLQVCELCSNISSRLLQQAFEIAKNVNIDDIIKNNQGKAIAEKILRERTVAIEEWLQGAS